MSRKSLRARKPTKKGDDYHKAVVARRTAAKTRRNRQAVRGELQVIPLRRTRSRSSSRSNRSSMSSLASKMGKLDMGSH